MATSIRRAPDELQMLAARVRLWEALRLAGAPGPDATEGVTDIMCREYTGQPVCWPFDRADPVMQGVFDPPEPQNLSQ